jgi:hypothetical protein
MLITWAIKPYVIRMHLSTLAGSHGGSLVPPPGSPVPTGTLATFERFTFWGGKSSTVVPVKDLQKSEAARPFVTWQTSSRSDKGVQYFYVHPEFFEESKEKRQLFKYLSKRKQ